MSVFDDEMPSIKLGDLDDLPCSSRKVTGGRARVPYKYPSRDGQIAEEMGREPYTFELEIPLFAGVNPDHYPSLADSLRSLLDDPPEPLEYQDHELGTMNVSIGPYSSEMDPMKRDGVIFRFTVTEDELDQGAAFRVLNPQPNVESAGEALDSELEEAGVTEPNVVTAMDKKGVGLKADERDYEGGTLWTSQAARVTDAINDGAATAEQIATTVDTLRGRVDALLSLPEMQVASAGSAMTAAILYLDAITQLGDRALATVAIEVEERILDTVSLLDVAARLYGDEQRVVELMARNPGVNPLFVPAGTVLIVPSR